MNLHGLRLFCKVAETGGVTRAAEELRISQPAVTAQIKNLERELGMPLLVPKGRRVLLTAAGKLLYEQAAKMFAQERQIQSMLEHYKAGRAGVLSVAATYLPANFLLPEWLAKFKQRHEEVEVSMTTTNSRGAFDKLNRYEAEIAVYGGGWQEQPDVEWDVLFEDELWFVVHRDHPYANREVGLVDMLKEPFVMREEGSSTRERLFALGKAYNAGSPRIALEFNGLNESIRAVLAGYGALFISALAVRPYVESGELARVYVSGVQMKNTIAICTRKGEPLSPVAEAFVRLIKANVKQVHL